MLRGFLQPGAIGRPQFVAAGLLCLYLAQCLWLVQVEAQHDIPEPQAHRILFGFQQWKGGAIAGTPEALEAEFGNRVPSSVPDDRFRTREGFDEDRSPLNYLIASAPIVLWPPKLTSLPIRYPLSLPFLFFGAMLGGSLWYVSRRLYGNAGGYIALVLYCFSPAAIANVAGPGMAEMGSVWGAFGAVFTAIAVAHTLYAPREVVLWNWRRILLLGLSLALAVGNQFSFAVMALVALLLMLWVAPVRRGAVVAIWSAACACALLIVSASYFFHPGLIAGGLAHARWVDVQPRGLIMPISYRYVLQTIFGGSPALMLALPGALVTFVCWKRTRYFGNYAPLLVSALLIFLAINAPQVAASTFLITALTFLFVFTAGVFADLLETRWGVFVMASVAGLLIASAVWNVLQLARGI